MTEESYSVSVETRCENCLGVIKCDSIQGGIFADENHYFCCEDCALAFNRRGKEQLKDLVQEDAVNHPSHYQGKSMEVIDVIEDFDLAFHLGNAIKYILRAGKKGSREEDINKAIWYLKRFISFEKEPE
jgi:hypothetical protein